MKLFQTAILALCLAIFLPLVSCGGGHSHNNSGARQDETATETPDQSGPEYTSAYICPMHCEGSGSDKAGKCPVCGMDYVANKNAKDQGDDHDHDHDDEGHDHEH